ncbi:hypothetical protein [Actinacidiphila acididurans]|uniref:HEPN AbiU2-like domain-containing protein n=1 Tax=Actinacidiphila acididurans TaxID=2784346 RepID=A0ABS2TUL4_9ACTN|nr:hypothetical protein [Actinacidiphila acididurans]MBM9506772.1 hypothetical protein [Actinacidiphila acididurans]
MAGLMDPLTEDQFALLDIVWTVFHERDRFPGFFYVDHMMREQERDATQTLMSFPAVGQHLVAYGYRAVHWMSIGAMPDPNGPVQVTAAGLYHLHNQSDALRRDDGLVQGLLAFMSQITAQRQKINNNPFEMPNVDVDLRTVDALLGRDEEFFERLALIAQKEWPGLNYNTHSFTGSMGQLYKADFVRLDDYLAAVSAALTRPEPPPAAMTVTDPRSLARALGHLDVTCELVLHRAVVPRPSLERSSTLVLGVDDQEGYNYGLAVLADLLRDFDVPGSKPSQGHNRLPGWLAGELRGIDQDAVVQAVQLLDQVRIVRNNAIHPNSSPDLEAAHRALGLPWPVRDHAAAWDSVRGNVEKAVNVLQETIQAARP